MAKFGKYIFSATDTTDVAAVGSTYNNSKINTVSLNTNTPQGAGTRFSGKLGKIFIKVKSISTAASITFRVITSDGLIIVPDTTQAISVSVASASVGGIAVDLDFDWAFADDTLTVVCKTNAGTLTIDQVTISWCE